MQQGKRGIDWRKVPYWPASVAIRLDHAEPRLGEECVNCGEVFGEEGGGEHVCAEPEEH